MGPCPGRVGRRPSSRLVTLYRAGWRPRLRGRVPRRHGVAVTVRRRSTRYRPWCARCRLRSPAFGPGTHPGPLWAWATRGRGAPSWPCLWRPPDSPARRMRDVLRRICALPFFVLAAVLLWVGLFRVMNRLPAVSGGPSRGLDRHRDRDAMEPYAVSRTHRPGVPPRVARPGGGARRAGIPPRCPDPPAIFNILAP